MNIGQNTVQLKNRVDKSLNISKQKAQDKTDNTPLAQKLQMEISFKIQTPKHSQRHSPKYTYISDKI